MYNVSPFLLLTPSNWRYMRVTLTLRMTKLYITLSSNLRPALATFWRRTHVLIGIVIVVGAVYRLTLSLTLSISTTLTPRADAKKPAKSGQQKTRRSGLRVWLSLRLNFGEPVE